MIGQVSLPMICSIIGNGSIIYPGKTPHPRISFFKIKIELIYNQPYPNLVYISIVFIKESKVNETSPYSYQQ